MQGSKKPRINVAQSIQADEEARRWRALKLLLACGVSVG